MKCISCISDENKSHKQHTADKDSLTWQLVVSIRRRKSSMIFGTLQVLCKSRGSSVVLAVLNRICHDFQTMPEITWKTFEHVPTTAYKVSLLTFTWHQTKTFDRHSVHPCLFNIRASFHGSLNGKTGLNFRTVWRWSHGNSTPKLTNFRSIPFEGNLSFAYVVNSP